MKTLQPIKVKEKKDQPVFEDISEINLIEKELHNALKESEGTIGDICSHILEAGGKKIRPLLTVYWGQVFSGLTPELLKAAAAAELIHMASLIHDDIIDNSDMRRNKPSINRVWGTHSAVLGGDYLFAKAFGILSGNQLLRSLDYMVEAIENMCSGEIIQAAARYNTGITIREYYNLIAMKTGVFLGCCCKSGAVVGGATDIQLKLAYNYGLNLGYAFQIVDDILDYYGEPKMMGKPRYEDLKQGGITLPIILLLKDFRYGSSVLKMLDSREFTEENLNELTELMEKTGVRDKCLHIATLHIEKAKKLVSLFPENKHSRQLIVLADKLRSRVW